MIDIVAYDPSWPIAFEVEAAGLRRALGARAVSIEHVGSTAVPGLAAKPVIDIQISVASLKPIQQFRWALARLGYAFVSLGEFDHVYPYFEKPRHWPHTHHVHLCEVGSEQERIHLAFRDYLRTHTDDAVRYAELKQRLAANCDGQTLDSREHYSLSKSEFINTIVARALAGGFPFST